MNALVLYDDDTARGFEPFALTRPVSELRAGTEIVRRRWERALDGEATGFIGAAHLADFEELDAPPMAHRDIASGTIIAHSRCAVALAAVDASADVWTCRGRVAAVRIARGGVALAAIRDGRTTLESLAPDGGVTREVDGWWIDEVWDLIRHLSDMLASDITHRVEMLDTVSAAAAQRRTEKKVW